MATRKPTTRTRQPSAKTLKAQKKAEEAEQTAALLRLMEREGEKDRYARMLCTDLYLRSGRSQNDLSSDNSDTQALREAFQLVEDAGDDMTAKRPFVMRASQELWQRIDELLHCVEMKPDPATGRYSGSDLGPLVTPESTVVDGKYANRYRRQPGNQVPFVMPSVDGSTLFAGMYCMDLDVASLLAHGVYLAHVLEALTHLGQAQNKKVDFTFVLTATQRPDFDAERQSPDLDDDVQLPSANDIKHFAGGNASEALKGLYSLFGDLVQGQLEETLMQQANDLRVLTILCAMPNPQTRAHVRFLGVGNDLFWAGDEFEEDFALAAWTVLRPLIYHLSTQENRTTVKHRETLWLPMSIIVHRLLEMGSVPEAMDKEERQVVEELKDFELA
jgi:hypothetical protein